MQERSQSATSLASSGQKGCSPGARRDGRTTVTFAHCCCQHMPYRALSNATPRPSLTMCALNAASIAVTAGDMAVLKP
eukprot:1324034-Prymnesium_polylepis.1